MPRRTKVSFKTDDGKRVTFFKPRKPCAECRRKVEAEMKADQQGDADLRAIGLILVLIVCVLYGVAMFILGYFLRESICTGQLVLVP